METHPLLTTELSPLDSSEYSKEALSTIIQDIQGRISKLILNLFKILKIYHNFI